MNISSEIERELEQHRLSKEELYIIFNRYKEKDIDQALEKLIKSNRITKEDNKYIKN